MTAHWVSSLSSCHRFQPSIHRSSHVKTFVIFIAIIILNSIVSIDARKHHLVLTNDDRKYITISTFGYFFGGHLSIEVNQFSDFPHKDDSVFGFTLAKTMSDSLTPYLEGHEDRCLLMDDVVTINNDENIGLVSMVFDFKNNVVNFKCNKLLSKLRFYDGIPSRPKRSDNISNAVESGAKAVPIHTDSKDTDYKPQPDDKQSAVSVDHNKKEPIDSSKVSETNVEIKSDVNKETKSETKENSNSIVSKLSDTIERKANEPKVIANNDKPIEISKELIPNSNEAKPDVNPDENSDAKESVKSAEEENKSCAIKSVKLIRSGNKDRPEFSFKIQAVIADEAHAGLYSLFFHNCPNYGSRGGFRKTTSFNLNISISEDNLGNYLSAGEIPLPQLYFALSVIFFLLGVIWIHVIRNKQNDAFKLHYLMASLVFVKAFSLLFHGINYHYISTEGSQVETWAVLYYITHLLKGALLFITIVLIGTGWAFVKHILSDKDKKIFMIVIPLQVLANIADIITEESEEGELKHNMWREIFILVDLLCCGAILFPVVWSIRHLQEASQTDGKAAINLRKLKLFRHFYVMIVCYIYFTRIIVYLLKITVPFQYEWLNVFFQHTATLAFFLLTGYHFQPTSTNPYFQLTQSDDDLEMEEVLFVQPNSGFNETKKRTPRDIEANVTSDTERLITKRESSHDFD